MQLPPWLSWDLGLRATPPLTFPGGQHWDAQGACLRGSLTTLPASLSGLTRLAHLDLSFNSLETLPACILRMCPLGALLLSHNLLSELPEALGALSALTFLSVTHNHLQALPAALGALSTLQRLDLSDNLLDTLPPEVGGLSSLQELNLASNRLQSLPAALGEYRRASGLAGLQGAPPAPAWPPRISPPHPRRPGPCTQAWPALELRCWPAALLGPVPGSQAPCSGPGLCGCSPGAVTESLLGGPSLSVPAWPGLAWRSRAGWPERSSSGPKQRGPQWGCVPCSCWSCTATSWSPCPPAWPASRCWSGWT